MTIKYRELHVSAAKKLRVVLVVQQYYPILDCTMFRRSSTCAACYNNRWFHAHDAVCSDVRPDVWSATSQSSHLAGSQSSSPAFSPSSPASAPYPPQQSARFMGPRPEQKVTPSTTSSSKPTVNRFWSHLGVLIGHWQLHQLHACAFSSSGQEELCRCNIVKTIS